MKITTNWIKNFLDFELPATPELVAKIGSQLGEVDGVENLGEKYQGIPVVKVVVCEPLENSDHLHKCLVDDGGVVKDVERDEKGLVQVLTGAPNVHQDMLAVWLAPGMTVPESADKDPFVLESRNMRGAMSHGMLASAKELALGDSHEGLLEIDKDVVPGTPFAEVYKLDDYVIDIENKMFTHRPDLFGALGVAREIAGITGHKFTSPDWYKQDAKITGGEGLNLVVEDEIPNQVPRFTAIAIKDVEIKPSPLWLQVALLKVGAKPINNVVDLTNFYMLVTGQPLHAYDTDKVATGKLGARFAKPGETLALLNGKTIELNEADMVITDGAKPIGLAGVMGGSETEVSNETKNIILECATFDMYAIRRTSMRHGLFTDAVTRFNKGQSPLQNLAVLAKITEDVQAMAGGTVASQLVDIDHTEGRTSVHPPVTVSTEYINTRLGLKLSADDMKQLLENVECSVAVDGSSLTVTAPFWRTDIELREDVVEEVGRLYGFDKLPQELPERSIQPVAKNTTLELKRQIREKLAKAGANEVLTYSFVHGDLLKKAGQNPDNAFKVDNALSPDLQYYRLSVMPSLLDKIHANIKGGTSEFALFELGKAHLVEQIGEDGLPREDELLGVVVTAADKLARAGAAFYAARTYVENLLGTAELTFKPIPEDMQAYDITKPYDMNRAAFIYAGETFLGIIGEFRSSVRRALKLPSYTAGFELDVAGLQQAVDIGATSYAPLLKFPSVTQDITLKVASDLAYADLRALVREELGANAPQDTHIRLEDIGVYQAADDAAHKNVTFRVHITGLNRTLVEKEVSSTVNAIAQAVKTKLGAERI